MRATLITLGALLATALVAMACLSVWIWRSLERPLGASEDHEVVFEVPEGASVRQILADLEAAGLIDDAFVARAYLVYGLEDPPLKAGEYRFEEPLTTPDVLGRLVRGNVVTHPVTVLEGQTVAETARLLVAAGFGDLDALLAEMSDPGRIADLDPEATDLEGYLFPDTYAFARGTAESEIVDAMVEAFRRRYAELTRGGALPVWASGPRSIVTLASIVEKEAGRDEERPVIAGVYANRLERGIGLYADPTVIYALKRLGRWDGNIRRADLALESPYNTYRVRGLPPGPICSPGAASLAAAIEPAEVPYLYFVSRNDGTHAFAATLSEHNANVERWQRKYWRDRRARERGEAGADAPPGAGD